MFEIVLRQDYEDIFFFREFEVTGIDGVGGSPDRTSSAGRISPSKSGINSRSRSPVKGPNVVHTPDG